MLLHERLNYNIFFKFFSASALEPIIWDICENLNSKLLFAFRVKSRISAENVEINTRRDFFSPHKHFAVFSFTSRFGCSDIIILLMLTFASFFTGSFFPKLTSSRKDYSRVRCELRVTTFIPSRRLGAQGWSEMMMLIHQHLLLNNFWCEKVLETILSHRMWQHEQKLEQFCVRL